MESGMLMTLLRKHGRAKIDYFYDELEAPLKPILENIWVIVYQKSRLCKIVQSVGGFSLGGADLVKTCYG